MAFTGVTNAHGPSPQPTACRSPSCCLTTATGSNQAKAMFKPTLPKKSWVDGGANQLPTNLGQFPSPVLPGDLVWLFSPPIIALV